MSATISPVTLPSPAAWQGALRLSDLAILQASGPDTASFLHGQLSQDIEHLGPTEARLAAYCSAKGRMLASAIVLRPQEEQVWLLCDASVLAALHKRLSMFVLRARTQLSDASASLCVLGLVGAEAMSRLSPSGAQASAAWGVQASQGGQVVTLPEVQGVPRALWIGPAGLADALLAGQPALPAAAWSWLDVMSGVPRIQAATADQFVPQMVNFEVLGGVNFQKGCYPGQEIVARSQYRGTIKRRAALVHSPAPLQAGQELFADSDPGQPAGMVIQGAPVPADDGTPASPGQAHSALVELKLGAWHTPVHAGAPDGPLLSWGAQPYALPSADDAS